MSVFDTSKPAGARAVERLGSESVIWLTTVGADGVPRSSPVWFVWDGETFLVYSMPGAVKVRSIRANPNVSLHLDGNGQGGDIVTLEGRARIEDGPPPDQVPAYLEKYRDGISGLGSTPDEFGKAYSTPIRVTPTRGRAY